jgi:LAO/AO transport system kinase
MWSLIDEKLEERFRNDPAVRSRLPGLESEVLAGKVSASRAADELLALFAETPRARD